MDHYNHTRVLEWASAWTMLTFGFFLVLPFDSFPATPHYYYVNLLTTEWRYGVVAIALSLFQMTSLEAHRCAFGREGRIIAAVMSGIGWAILSFLLMLGSSVTHDWVAYGCLSGFMVYAVHHLHKALERR